MIDFREAFGDSDSLRTTNDLTRSCKHCLHRNILSLLNIRRNPQPSPDLEYADLDMCKAMLAAGGPNYDSIYETVAARCGYPHGTKFREHPQGDEAR